MATGEDSSILYSPWRVGRIGWVWKIAIANININEVRRMRSIDTEIHIKMESIGCSRVLQRQSS